MLILLVVFAHCLYELRNKEINEFVLEYIYFFHMPAFVFVSGYFSKSKRDFSMVLLGNTDEVRHAGVYRAIIAVSAILLLIAPIAQSFLQH